MTASPAPAGGALARRLGLRDAVVIGLASMIGAGAFVSLGAAVELARWLAPLAVLIAAGVALCNATSSAQLAAQHPSSGGTYHFGREQLGPWWGFLAGWCFVIGKTASCAAMALVIAAYLVPEGLQRPVAALAVVVLTGVNLVGITRTAALARVLVTIALGALVLTGVRLLVGLPGVEAEAGPADATLGGPAYSTPVLLWDRGLAGALDAWAGGPLGVALAVAQAAALMFFAFAGYARVATLGEEVVEPRRTIPRAILLALGIVTVLYLALSVVLVQLLPALSVGGWGPAPFLTALEIVGAGAPWRVIITVGAVAAAAGALLALIAGISRTTLAMARERDLPPVLAHVDPARSVPQRAELAAGIAIVLIVLLAPDVLTAIAASSFGVLLYYAIANLSAFTQRAPWRLYPKAMQVIGVVSCVLLVASLPGRTIAAGVALLAVGVAYRGVVLWRRRSREGAPNA
ncbi:APC family permease [Brachybacterium sp. YJGR34]|uniref:APC family permease n=1 Tax=Brachybacterium sp. YJGR34 TaxID=2059911 RepID=UPI000E0C2FB9|nr:APC family permease [Brachybacterium sp. YJGR34]